MSQCCESDTGVDVTEEAAEETFRRIEETLERLTVAEQTGRHYPELPEDLAVARAEMAAVRQLARWTQLEHESRVRLRRCYNAMRDVLDQQGFGKLCVPVVHGVYNPEYPEQVELKVIYANNGSGIDLWAGEWGPRNGDGAIAHPWRATLAECVEAVREGVEAGLERRARLADALAAVGRLWVAPK